MRSNGSAFISYNQRVGESHNVSKSEPEPLPFLEPLRDPTGAAQFARIHAKIITVKMYILFKPRPCIVLRKVVNYYTQRVHSDITYAEQYGAAAGFCSVVKIKILPAEVRSYKPG